MKNLYDFLIQMGLISSKEKAPAELYKEYVFAGFAKRDAIVLPSLGPGTAEQDFEDGILGHLSHIVKNTRESCLFGAFHEYMFALFENGHVPRMLLHRDQVKFLKRLVALLKEIMRRVSLVHFNIPYLLNFLLHQRRWITEDAIQDPHSKIEVADWPLFMRARVLPVQDIYTILRNLYNNDWIQIDRFPNSYFKDEEFRRLVQSSFTSFRFESRHLIFTAVPQLTDCLEYVDLDELWRASRRYKSEERATSEKVYRTFSGLIKILSSREIRSTRYRFQKLEEKVPDLADCRVVFLPGKDGAK